MNRPPLPSLPQLSKADDEARKAHEPSLTTKASNTSTPTIDLDDGDLKDDRLEICAPECLVRWDNGGECGMRRFVVSRPRTVFDGEPSRRIVAWK
jgi:hypothetical protein